MRLRTVIDWLLSVRPADPSRPVSISLAGGTEREQSGRDQLRRLLKDDNLRKWQYTNRVRIEQGVISHSHPVLTLNARHLEDDSLALSAYLHEQLHWFVWRRIRKKRRAMRELRQRYPNPPSARGGDESSTYLHFLICYLEYRAMIEAVGREEARRVIEFLSTDHYTEIYKTVLRDFDEIGEIAARHALAP